jgi:hypothetical protein
MQKWFGGGIGGSGTRNRQFPVLQMINPYMLMMFQQYF